MNIVCLIGNVTKDIELVELPNGSKKVSFYIAVNRPYTTPEGDQITDFLNILAWGNLAQTCAKYLKKGSKIAVFGDMQIYDGKDKDGNERRQTFVRAQSIEFLNL